MVLTHSLYHIISYLIMMQHPPRLRSSTGPRTAGRGLRWIFNPPMPSQACQYEMAVSNPNAKYGDQPKQKRRADVGART